MKVKYEDVVMTCWIVLVGTTILSSCQTGSSEKGMFFQKAPASSVDVNFKNNKGLKKKRQMRSEVQRWEDFEVNYDDLCPDLTDASPLDYGRTSVVVLMKEDLDFDLADVTHKEILSLVDTGKVTWGQLGVEPEELEARWAYARRQEWLSACEASVIFKHGGGYDYWAIFRAVNSGVATPSGLNLSDEEYSQVLTKMKDLRSE